MSLEYIAVEGCTIEHDAGSPISGGSFTITSIASAKVKVGGKGVYAQQIDFTFKDGNGPGVSPGTVVGGGSILSKATKDRAEGQLVVRENDTGTLSGAGTNPAPPPPTLPVSGGVIISAAGQTKARGR